MSKRKARNRANATRKVSATPRAMQKVQVKNNVGRFSGLGSEFDFSQYQQPANVPLSPCQQDKFAVDLYYSDWAAKKIVSIPVDDMLRHGWSYEGVTDDQRMKMEADQSALDVLDQIKQAMRLERLIGGCVIFMGVADGQASPKEPINYAALGPGCLKFLNVIPRTRITQTQVDFDPLSPTYGRPITYWVNGQEVHHSRLLLFKGDPLTQVPDSTIMPTQWVRNDGFGVSVLMSLLDDLTRATGSRQAAYQLVQRASVFLFQTDMMDLEGTKEGQNKLAMLQNIVNQINLYRGAVVDRQPGQSDPITTISPQFGSVPELVMSFIQILSAASDIPATRFLGQAPGGLNATGESDLENYYGRLESAQKQQLLPQLMKFMKVFGPSSLGESYDPKTLKIVFDPLWSLSELEQSQVRAADVANVVALQSAQLLEDFECLEELKLRDAIAVEVVREEEALLPADAPPLDETLAELGAIQ